MCSGVAPCVNATAVAASASSTPAAPAARRAAAEAMADDGGTVLAVGTSLAVMSGYRFVLRAERAGHETGLINLGPTRADAKARWRWRAPVADALAWLDARL